MTIMTEADLRAEGLTDQTKEFHIQPDVKLTPSAREFLMDRQIKLVIDEAHTMTVEPIKKPAPADPNAKFVDAETGEGYDVKPEDMTHLRGNILVKKTHPRIALRGKLDGLQARILLLEARFPEKAALRADLDNVRSYVAHILQGEVKDIPLEEIPLLNLTLDEIHEMSHNVQGHFGISHQIPDVSMGVVALELNLLRTEVREAELFAANAFPKGDSLGVIAQLNRLSSGIYILFCRTITGYYEKIE